MAQPPGLRLRYHPKVVKDDIPRLDGDARRRVRAAIESKLTHQPEQFAKPLAYTLAGTWSLRVGPWRVIFALRDRDVWILKIGHRSEVFQSSDREIPRSP